MKSLFGKLITFAAALCVVTFSTRADAFNWAAQCDWSPSWGNDITTTNSTMTSVWQSGVGGPFLNPGTTSGTIMVTTSLSFDCAASGGGWQGCYVEFQLAFTSPSGVAEVGPTHTFFSGDGNHTHVSWTDVISAEGNGHLIELNWAQGSGTGNTAEIWFNDPLNMSAFQS